MLKVFDFTVEGQLHGGLLLHAGKIVCYLPDSSDRLRQVLSRRRRAFRRVGVSQQSAELVRPTFQHFSQLRRRKVVKNGRTSGSQPSALPCSFIPCLHLRPRPTPALPPRGGHYLTTILPPTLLPPSLHQASTSHRSASLQSYEVSARRILVHIQLKLMCTRRQRPAEDSLE